MTATRAGADAINCASVRATSASEGERPSRTALVESPMTASTPSSPSRRSLASSVGWPTTGVGSSFQSPVCSTLPCGVRRISALDSGIECAIETSSMSNGPTLKRLPSGTVLMLISGAPGFALALGLDQGRGERRRIDRHFQLRPQIEQRAEMILVRMRRARCRRCSFAPRRDSGYPGTSGRCRADVPRTRTTPRHPRSAIAAGARRRARRSTGSCRSRRPRRAAQKQAVRSVPSG